MDRLAEQVVAWHNSHPLAKRITIYDVHTIGVVALPFMRSGRSAAGQVEPVLTDEVSPESLAAAWSDESTLADNTNAAHLDALADQEAPPPGARRGWRERLGGWLGRRNQSPGGGEAWPVFSERFVTGLSPRRIAAFAQQHAYSVRPGDASWPLRDVPIDERMLARGNDKTVSGAWPFERYLMSAAIDAGASRSRVLIGRGGVKPPIAGRRCLSPRRVGLVALLALALLGLAAAIWWPDEPASDGKAAPMTTGPAASAASAVTAAPSMAAQPMPASLASAPAAEPPPAAAASVAETAVDDIRPPSPPSAPTRRASERLMPAAGSDKAASSPAPVVPAPQAPATQALAPPAEAASAALKPDVRSALQSGKPVVALVGPISANKAEAEAMLSRMRGQITPLAGDPAAIQAQVFQTPEGWRPAVWPFASREEAQLINATLIARGMRTKAVDF